MDPIDAPDGEDASAPPLPPKTHDPMDPIDVLNGLEPEAIQAKIDDLTRQAALLRQLLHLSHQWHAWRDRGRRKAAGPEDEPKDAGVGEGPPPEQPERPRRKKGE